MNSLQPCTGYLPSTIAGSPRKRYSTSCNSITPILRSGFRTRPCSYQGGRRLWSAFTNANNKQRTMASEPHRPPHHHVHAADRRAGDSSGICSGRLALDDRQRGRAVAAGGLFWWQEIEITSGGDGVANHSGGRALCPNHSVVTAVANDGESVLYRVC